MIRKILSIALFLIAVVPAFGTVTFVLDSNSTLIYAAPGDDPIFSGTLTADPVADNLNWICGTTNPGPACTMANNFGPAYLTFDFLGTFFSTPGNGFSTYTGPIFDVLIDPTAPSGLYSGTATILGGADLFAVDPLASANFQIFITPEPGTVALLAVGLALLTWWRRCHRPVAG